MSGSTVRFAAFAGLAVLASGCLDEIVKVTERDIIPPDAINTPAGASALYAGALREFGIAVRQVCPAQVIVRRVVIEPEADEDAGVGIVIRDVGF